MESVSSDEYPLAMDEEDDDLMEPPEGEEEDDQMENDDNDELPDDVQLEDASDSNDPGERPFRRARIEREEEEEEQPYIPLPAGFLLPGDEGYVRPDSPRTRAAKRAAEEEEYYNDEYGQGDPEMIKLRHTDLYEFFDNPYTIDEDDEDEEHVAGMILPKVDLTDEDVYFRELFWVCCKMGKETTRLLEQLLVAHEPLTPPDRALCLAWVKYWSSYAVENHYLILGRILSIPTGPDGAMERVSGTMCIMGEVWRLKLILNHHRLGELKRWKITDSPFLVQWLLETPGVPLDCPPKEPEEPQIKDGRVPSVGAVEKYKKALLVYQEQLAEFEKSRRIAETPIMALRQSQIRHLIQYVTKKLRIIPYGDDIRTFFEIVELKTAIFFCQTLPGTQLDDTRMRTDIQKALDKIVTESHEQLAKRAKTSGSEYVEAVEDALALGQQVAESQRSLTGKWCINRDFWIYCACYMYPVMRCLYYVDLFPLMRLENASNVESYLPAGSTKRMEEWCRSMARQQGDKYFDRLNDAADEALRHPGDMEWLAYKYPDESTNIAVVLRKVRGENEYEEHYTVTGLSSDVILNQVNVNPLSTFYVLNLFDRYLNTYKGTDWADGYVIQEAFICDEETHDKWTRTREPMLIQVFSNYWLLMDAKVLPINNIYVSLCMWLMAIRKTRPLAVVPKDCLADNTFIGDIIDKILLGKGTIEYAMEGNADEEHFDRIRRGLDVNTTRVHI